VVAVSSVVVIRGSMVRHKLSVELQRL